MARVTVNIGVLKVELDDVDFRRFSRTKRVLHGGPCLLLCRQWGRALDAGWDAAPGWQPVVWDAHAYPWQQWLLQADGDATRIVSASTGLALTAETGGNWAPIRLQQVRSENPLQRWRLRATDDGAAYLIENFATGKAIDACDKPENGTQPHQWDGHWAAWQQWTVARLPLASRR